MPPRHAYWTIIVDDQPTAFRAHDPEELLPTLNRLREKNQSAVMKWFERGQLFESREAAKDVGFGRGERRWEGPRPDASLSRRSGAAAKADPRDKAWRPGGEHRDPRQKHRDAKKAKWNRFKQGIRDRQDRRRPQADHPGPEFSPPHGDPLRDEIRPRAAREERRDDRRGAPSKPHGDELQSRPRRPEWRGERRDQGDQRDRPFRDDRGGWQDRDRGAGPKTFSGRPGAARKPWGAKPASSTGPRKPWGARPAGAGGSKPWSTRPAGANSRKPWESKPGAGARKPWGKPAGSAGRKPFGPRPPGRPAPTGKPKRRRDDEE